MFAPARLADGLEPLSVPDAITSLSPIQFNGHSVPPLTTPKCDHSADKELVESIGGDAADVNCQTGAAFIFNNFLMPLPKDGSAVLKVNFEFASLNYSRERRRAAKL